MSKQWRETFSSMLLDNTESYETLWLDTLTIMGIAPVIVQFITIILGDHWTTNLEDGTPHVHQESVENPFGMSTIIGIVLIFTLQGLGTFDGT